MVVLKLRAAALHESDENVLSIRQASDKQHHGATAYIVPSTH